MKNEYEVTEKLYQSWGMENMLKGVRLKFMIFWSILAVVSLILCVVYSWNPLFIVIFLFCLYRAFLRNFVMTKGQYRNLKKAHGTDRWIRTVNFKNDGIVVNDGNASVTYSYGDIVAVRVKGNKIWLDTNKQGVIRLYKNAFIGCDCNQCINIIKSKNPFLSN